MREDKIILVIEKLTKKFGGVTAVDEVDLTVKEGCLIAIIGPNGSGKTTLLNLISGHLEPTAGKIYFRGEDITKMTPRERALKGISRTYQISQNFRGLTVLENIWLAAQPKSRLNFFRDYRKYKDIEEKVRKILATVNLEHKASFLASQCSYGELRRLEIGRALATDPALLLMDEPTAGVSPKERSDVVDLIGKLAAEKTIILVEHAMDVVRELADEVVVLERGRIIKIGEPEEVLESKEVQTMYMRG